MKKYVGIGLVMLLGLGGCATNEDGSTSFGVNAIAGAAVAKECSASIRSTHKSQWARYQKRVGNQQAALDLVEVCGCVGKNAVNIGNAISLASNKNAAKNMAQDAVNEYMTECLNEQVVRSEERLRIQKKAQTASGDAAVLPKGKKNSAKGKAQAKKVNKK